MTASNLCNYTCTMTMGVCYDRRVVSLILPTGALQLDENIVEQLRDTAAAMAGRSSAARDLSLVLDRAINGGYVALRRAELQTLVDVVDAAGLSELRDRLA
jgi:hypothetical protein